MSLINDALKRARDAQGDAPPAAPPLQPVPRPAGGGPGWVLSLAAALSLCAAVVLTWTAFFARKPAGKPLPPAAPAAVAAATPPAVRIPATVAPLSNAAAATAPVAKKTVPVEKFPAVQGIIFTRPHPVAIVDGKVVGVGDNLGGFRVKEITRSNVIFQRPDGSVKQLGVGQ